MGSFCSSKKVIPKNNKKFGLVTVSSSQISINSIYDIQDVIARGNFGVVRRAKIGNDREFAIKTINKKELTVSVSRVLLEIETLLSIDHPNIVKCYETFEDLENIHIVMEYCSEGEMLDIFPETGPMTETDALRYTRTLLMSVNHIHQLGIIHRDLKPENFLFSNTKNPESLKLVDFGLSSKFSSKMEKLHSKVGTPYYIAPEVIQGSHNSKCDMWSIGVIFYIMLSGEIPFYSESVSGVFKKILSGEYDITRNPAWTEVSEESKHLLERLLCLNTRDRLSALEALMHPAIFSIPKIVKKQVNVFQKLQKYSKLPLFKRCALAAMIKYVNFNEGSWERKVFIDYDRSLTGVITAIEVSDILEGTGCKFSQKELNQIMNSIGIRNEGKIYFSEFMSSIFKFPEELEEEYQVLAFSFFDRDRRGFFDCLSLKNALSFLGKKVTTEEARNMINHLGREGVVRFEDFKKVFH